MKCYRCLEDTVSWSNDFSFEDFNYEGEGIVSIYFCSNCNSEIEIKECKMVE